MNDKNQQWTDMPTAQIEGKPLQHGTRNRQRDGDDVI